LETVGTAALIIVALTPIMITFYTSGLLNRINAPKKNKGLVMALVIAATIAVAAVICLVVR
ncbi:MAG: hypothetical protein IJ385_03385, partial [Ruminiclostridium sp.]|nr:hypothetical protein [Ruminiclostridium sp.]